MTGFPVLFLILFWSSVEKSIVPIAFGTTSGAEFDGLPNSFFNLASASCSAKVFPRVSVDLGAGGGGGGGGGPPPCIGGGGGAWLKDGAWFDGGGGGGGSPRLAGLLHTVGGGAGGGLEKVLGAGITCSRFLMSCSSAFCALSNDNTSSRRFWRLSILSDSCCLSRWLDCLKVSIILTMLALEVDEFVTVSSCDLELILLRVSFFLELLRRLHDDVVGWNWLTRCKGLSSSPECSEWVWHGSSLRVSGKNVLICD